MAEKRISTRHLVDPELLAGLEMIPTIDFSFAALPGIRRQMAEFSAARSSPQVPGTSTSACVVRSPQGHCIDVLVHRADGLAPHAPAVVYAHGGGFLLGSAASMQTSNQQLAKDVRCVVVSIDYRLPPEVPHPGPVEDCHAALKWVYDNGDELGVDRSRIALAGESAGAGLAAATALLARDRREVPVVHQHLIYPMLDDRTGPGTANPLAGEFVWTAQNNELGWSALLGAHAGGESVSGYAAPARAQDLPVCRAPISRLVRLTSLPRKTWTMPAG